MESFKFFGIISLVCLFALALPLTSAEPDSTTTTEAKNLWEDIKNMRVTEIKRSALACPLPLVGSSCSEETPLYYFACCGELNASCCFRLQDWVIALLGILTILVVLSIVINCIRCMCGC
jgi:hypothetical protein|uniref:Uncharacterized protein n=1 Tax=Panagrolaimus davidi TaxID=227884 RepID=A0A914PRS4_9BILA